MPYSYRDDIALADTAFDAWGDTAEDMFSTAADALFGIMIENPESITRQEALKVELRAENIEMLLFSFLDELIYRKDVKSMLLRVDSVKVQESSDGWNLNARLFGEEIDPEKHKLLVDVKAVTLHRFEVKKTSVGWNATVVVDI